MNRPDPEFHGLTVEQLRRRIWRELMAPIACIVVLICIWCAVAYLAAGRAP